MLLRRVIPRAAIALALFVAFLTAQIPTPKDHFGFNPGDELKLAGYDEITGYFKKLAASSERLRLVEFGKSSEGRSMYVAFISSPENLKSLDRYREINRRLALGLAIEEQARKLASEGKAIVWIDSGLHATEVAPVQHSPHLAYKMLTDESEEVRRIRANVILMQVPVINPDGLEMTVEWYRSNIGTQHEVAPLPKLYQKYAGHDNNRDYFMLNLPETRHVSRMLFREWFPHIVYNQHQVAPFPARIFIPPYGEPLNPNIPAAVMEGINLIGSVMKERFARENKPGAISYAGFDAWWNGGLRSVPAFHNMHGILTETALHAYATPRVYNPSDMPERFSSGIPTKEPSVFYERPWLGGRWALMDAVEYMLTADFAILDLAASRPESFLLKAWEMARSNIEAGGKGKPFAYVLPAQHDAWSAVEMLRRLQMAGIEIRRSEASFTAGNKLYPSGTWYILASQPFRSYLVDLMEPQKYPELRAGQTGPTKRPYDLAGWTLPYQMGVQVDRLDDPAGIPGEIVPDIPPLEPSLDYRQNSSFLTLARLLASGVKVRRASNGEFLVEGKSKTEDWNKALLQVSAPRVAVYEPYTSNMDAGWTQWLLDTFRVPYFQARNEEIRKGKLRDRYDTIILAEQSMQSILHGTREGEIMGRAGQQQPSDGKNLQRPQFTGGIGLEGANQLLEFVRQGGTLIAFDAATELPVTLFPIGVRSLIRPGEPETATSWYCPGSILRATANTDHPFAFGMPRDIYLTSTGGQAFEITMLPEFNKGAREVKPVVTYAKANLLASGWLSGERLAAGRAAAVDARLGEGHVVLFGFRPQFRGQSFGTFKLILNAIYASSSTTIARD